VFHPHLLVLFALLACFPSTFDARALALLVVGAVALALFAWGGGLSVARAVGLARRRSARLAAVVERAAARVGTRPRAVYELSALFANALAFPLSKRLAFTDGALAALDDEELTAVCAHELAHLTEPPRLVLGRVAPLALVLALPLARLISSAEGLIAFEAAFVAAALVAGLGRRLSRGLEGRADELARAHEGEPGAYARALAKIYEVNLVPPVLGGKGATHPHLYDRLEAAGSPPGYERPPPPPSRLFARSALATLLLAALGCAALEAGHFPPLADTRGDERRAYWLLALYGGAPQLANLALARFQGGDRDGAVALYRAAAAADEASAFYPANLAIVLAGLGRCEEAEAAAREAVERLRRKDASRGESQTVTKAWDALDWCRARRGAPPCGWAGPPGGEP
jgi:Zn-dependent protease with chaperone function